MDICELLSQLVNTEMSQRIISFFLFKYTYKTNGMAISLSAA